MWSELGLRGVVIFVDHCRDDGLSADGSRVGHVPDGLRFDGRGPLLPGSVRPVVVVVDQVLAEYQGQVAFAEDHYAHRRAWLRALPDPIDADMFLAYTSTRRLSA